MTLLENHCVEFYNGVKCPLLGLGTYLGLGDECYEAVKAAIGLGYRHIDTAAVYKNEKQVGRAVNDAIAEFGLRRDELFVVTKLSPTCNHPRLVVAALRQSNFSSYTLCLTFSLQAQSGIFSLSK